MRPKSWLVLGLMLSTGIVIGAFGAALFFKGIVRDLAVPSRPPGPERIVERLSHHLELSKEQREQALDIFMSFEPRMHEIHESVKPRMDAILDEIQVKMKEILDQKQAQELEHFVKKIKSRELPPQGP